MKKPIQQVLYRLIDDMKADDGFNPPEDWEEGEIHYLLSQSADRITNLETANKEAYKALLECEALVKEYPLVHQWTVAALGKLKELQQ